ncbi:hypothetical protein ACLVWU_05665 [Bdellovibrio sp. HCB290]|uniref:hypothetical protein n=1 Tax=Bdellovibrio sp. HCB290 TaxID=3394356 RepID=UPI0039B4F24E
MDMVISRFSNVQADAAKLCKQMKALKKSGRATNLIFEKYFNYEKDTDRLNILGHGDQIFLDPLYNG